jgi:sodium/proline symporter
MKENILPILIDFIIYGIIVITIACLAKKYTKNLSDYILGGRSLSGIITALSVGASDMSSWLLMALPGVVYLSGLSMIWNPIGLLLGAYCNWKFIASRLRTFTEVFDDSLTLPAYLCNRFKNNGKGLRIVTSLAILIFFIFYSVSGFVSGATLTNMTFGIDYLPSLFISAAVVVLYTTIGGFLAVSWIDFFQGSLMFVSLLVVPTVGFMHLGGVQHSIEHIIATKAEFLSIFANIKFLGVVSLFAWGLGYFGQPHINLRFMAIRSVKELPIARRICMTWMALSLFGAVLTGLVGSIFFLSDQVNKHETIFIMLSHALFNPWITGILLSAILSAIMSNVSALILMSASILVEDFYRGLFRKQASNKECLWVGRMFLISVASIAVIIAAQPEITIFKSVAFAWSGLGASFGPVIIFSLYWKKMTRAGAIAGIFAGCITVIFWGSFVNVGGKLDHLGLFPGIEILPGFILSSFCIVLISLFTEKPRKEILDKFDLAISNENS